MSDKSPEERARDIFANAVDYHICCDWLTRIKTEQGSPEFRVVGPMFTMAAFASELFLKSLLVDAGCTGVPVTHDLSKLVSNAPKLLRANLVKRWKQLAPAIRPKPKIADLGFVEAVQSVASNFEKWRYRHEVEINARSMKDNGAFLLMMFLKEFILHRHPDWSDPNRTHYLSAFQFPKRLAAGAFARRKASDS